MDRKSTYCCGGGIAIAIDHENTQMSKQISPPIIIRWDASDGQRIHRLTLPNPIAEADAVDRLVRDCAPATFGHHEEEILDGES